jgi:hypothetical protein
MSGHDAPPPQTIRAVQRALGSRNRQIQDDLSSLDVLLHIDYTGGEVTGPPAAGTSAGEMVVHYFEDVAAQVRKVRAAVAAVDFDPGDKQRFMVALEEAAKSWDARALMSSTTDPETAAAALKAAEHHDAKAAEDGKPLKVYFKGAH